MNTPPPRRSHSHPTQLSIACCARIQATLPRAECRRQCSSSDETKGELGNKDVQYVNVNVVSARDSDAPTVRYSTQAAEVMCNLLTQRGSTLDVTHEVVTPILIDTGSVVSVTSVAYIRQLDLLAEKYPNQVRYERRGCQDGLVLRGASGADLGYVGDLHIYIRFARQLDECPVSGRTTAHFHDSSVGITFKMCTALGHDTRLLCGTRALQELRARIDLHQHTLSYSVTANRRLVVPMSSNGQIFDSYQIDIGAPRPAKGIKPTHDRAPPAPHPQKLPQGQHPNRSGWPNEVDMAPISVPPVLTDNDTPKSVAVAHIARCCGAAGDSPAEGHKTPPLEGKTGDMGSTVHSIQLEDHPGCDSPMVLSLLDEDPACVLEGATAFEAASDETADAALYINYIARLDSKGAESERIYDGDLMATPL